MARVNELWGNVEPGTAAGDEFDILCTLVEVYEKVHFPIAAPEPSEILRFRLEQLGLPAAAVQATMQVVAEQFTPRSASLAA